MKNKYVVAFMATLFILTNSLITLAQPAAAPTADDFGVEDASGNKGTYVVVPVTIKNVKNSPILGIGFNILYVHKISIEVDKNVSDVNVMIEKVEKPEEITDALGIVYAYYS